MFLEIRPVEKVNDRLNAELYADHCFHCYAQLPATFPPGTYPLGLKQDKQDAAWVLALSDVPNFPQAAIAARPAPDALLVGRDLRGGELRQQAEAMQGLMRLVSHYISAGGLTITVHALPARVLVMPQAWPPLAENPLLAVVDEAIAPPPARWVDRFSAPLFAVEMFLLCEVFIWAWHVLTFFRWRDWLQDAIICAVTFTLGVLSGQNDRK